MIRKRQNRHTEAREKQMAETMPNLSTRKSGTRTPKKKIPDNGILTSFLIKLIIELNNRMVEWAKSTPMVQYLLADHIGNTWLRILASCLSIYCIGVR
jgi:hypothetical protein